MTNDDKTIEDDIPFTDEGSFLQSLMQARDDAALGEFISDRSLTLFVYMIHHIEEFVPMAATLNGKKTMVISQVITGTDNTTTVKPFFSVIDADSDIKDMFGNAPTRISGLAHSKMVN